MKTPDAIYQRIAQDLRAGIARGDYPPGARLPTEQDISEQYSVSRHTAREALQLLRNEGLIARKRGVGSVVESNDDRGVFTQTIGGVADLLQYARNARLDVLSMRAANEGEVKAAGLDIDSAWTRILGVRRVAPRRLPVASTRIFIRSEICPPRADVEAHHGALNELIVARSNIRTGSIEQEISAVAVSAKAADLLGMAIASPALLTRRAYRSIAGEIYQLSLSLHPGDRFIYRMQLDRA